MTRSLALLSATRACPKHMVYGPCGGVRHDGGCEVAGIACSFTALADQLAESRFDPSDAAIPESARESGDALRAATERSAAAMAFAGLVAVGGLITADLTIRTTEAGALAEAAPLMSGLSAVVVGEPPGLGASLSPAHKALVLQSAGIRVIAGVNCRDRNRVALEGELAALADIGVAGVLGVTGDHPASTVRPDAEAVFDLDSTRVAALARRAGMFVAVAEQPIAPPVAYRPHRLALKVEAGAELCFLNLCGGPDRIARFAAEARAAGAGVPLVASVPVITSARGAARLAALPGIALPEGLAERVASAPDPERAGIDEAARLAASLLTIPGVVGVHLSAIGGDDDPSGLGAARTIARTAELIRERAAAAPPTAILTVPAQAGPAA
ncbi:methylenetetrahydrofolate reductase C-terminal domain-containing protein [uncultured Microbacterium sp.]|uniref:methylenetetrahydrofolate reductase C-terminal domain-containing protein n=1 Tax=uncultured Microbacterium sp. TaxID=191216 RepID=UPI00260537B6|nr:methylenetetrahydrofolate reductase C-terminal domain-containing protein [uncultured Microbacterium sp.]